MLDFSFLAIPNIESMRLLRYIEVFGVVLLLGACLFFVLYFWFRYRRTQKAIYQLDDIDKKSQQLRKQLLQQKIHKASGKTKLILFIEYLEKFITTDATLDKPVQAYANLLELLLSQGFTSQEVVALEQVLYTDAHLSKHLESAIDNYFTS